MSSDRSHPVVRRPTLLPPVQHATYAVEGGAYIMLDARHEVRFRRLHQKVIMVAHQHPRVNAPASHGARIAQRLEQFQCVATKRSIAAGQRPGLESRPRSDRIAMVDRSLLLPRLGFLLRDQAFLAFAYLVPALYPFDSPIPRIRVATNPRTQRVTWISNPISLRRFSS